MDEDDVIEIGEDGCFELPSPSVSSTGVVNSLGSKEESEDSNLKNSSIQSIFAKLQDNQYRIYKTGGTGLVVIMKVTTGIKLIRVGKKLLVVETTTPQESKHQFLKIPLPFDIQTNSENVECKYFESFIIISLKLS